MIESVLSHLFPEVFRFCFPLCEWCFLNNHWFLDTFFGFLSSNWNIRIQILIGILNYLFNDFHLSNKNCFWLLSHLLLKDLPVLSGFLVEYRLVFGHISFECFLLDSKIESWYLENYLLYEFLNFYFLLDLKSNELESVIDS